MTEELKVVIALKEGRASIGLQAPDCDPMFVTLPGGLQTDKADADYTNGVLTLSFPKAEEVKPKTIKVATKQ